MSIETIEGDFSSVTGRYAIVVARFNSFLVESLVDGAVDTLLRHGVSESDIQIVRVPGAFEILSRGLPGDPVCLGLFCRYLRFLI